MVNFFKKYWPPLFIFLISLFVFVVNYKSGTFLTGWDTLHPEFDFLLNIKRAFFGVWRPEQGLGALAGHSHMADLPRILILWILSLALPINLLRYSYIFLMFLMGGLGIYFLISHLFYKFQIKNYQIIAFISSLLYLFNLSTIQNFYVPFEMFPTQFGLLPWIILFSIKYINENNKRNLIFFSFFTLLSTPQAYAAHLWYVFFVIYTVFLLLLSYLRKQDKFVFKRSIFLILITLIINSFWLLPNLYFVATSSDIPRNSKQNRLFSQEYRLRNREHGDIENVALLKGFYFNWSIYNFETNNTVPLMKEWNAYTDNLIIKSIGYLIFLSSLTGLYLAFYKKNKILMSLSPLFAIPFIFLMNNTFPFNKFFDFLLNFSLFNEGLRFVFNKFSIIFTFSYALFFAYFLSFVLNNKNKILTKFLPFFIIFAILLCNIPVFKGDLISDKVQVKIPNEYFDFWKFMKTQEQGTVLTLPVHNFPGWEYYKWGYQGAGFIWFGLKQPILVRDFDRWSVANEQAFREFHYSVYSRNLELFESNLDKFNIKYILWDKNITTQGSKNRDQILYLKEIDNILKDLIDNSKVKKIGQFNNINMFRVKNKTDEKILQAKNQIWPKYTWSNFDYAFLAHSNYITSFNINENNILYPLRNFVDEKDRINKEVFSKQDQIESFKINIPENFKYDFINLPSINEENILISDISILDSGNSQYQISLKPLLIDNIDLTFDYKLKSQEDNNIKFNLNGRNYSIARSALKSTKKLYLGQAFIYLKDDNYLDGNKIVLNKAQFENINIKNQLITKFPIKSLNISKKQIIKQKNGYYLKIEDLPHYLGYAIVINSKNINGLPLRFCLKNLYSDVCTIYDELSSFKNYDEDIFLVPPSDNSVGYSLSFDNISYGNFKADNNIENIKIIPFPYNFLSNVYVQKRGENKSSTIITNNQTFHKGWVAYLSGKRLKEHVLVNNWANGWVVDDNVNIKDVKIVFWPQYLEYLGFLFLIFSFAWMIFWKKKI